jgi:two-component system OmpR family response regulator
LGPAANVTKAERILVVDDEPGMRELLLAFFRKNGYQTVAAPDAVEGFDLVAEIDPTVVIIDYRIAGGGGINLIAKIREHFPAVRCLFMTAFDSPDYFERAATAGAHDTLQKPFDLLDLLAKVERQIKLYHKAALDRAPRRLHRV